MTRRTICGMTAAGLVLLIVGVLVALSEAHSPTHGAAGGIGLLLMAVGVVLAVSGLGAGIAFGLLGGVALAGVGAAALALTVRRSAAVRRQRVRTGAEGLIGEIGVVRSWGDGDGSVSLQGGVWRARRSPTLDDDEPEPALANGDRVVVERLSGLTLSVRRAEEWELI